MTHQLHVAVATQIMVFPLSGAVSLGDNLTIGCIFTILSVVSEYLLLRLSDRLH